MAEPENPNPNAQASDDDVAKEWEAMSAAPAAQPSDDDMAKEWEAMSAGGGGGDANAGGEMDDMAAAMGADGKVLNQDEIDSLLGFDSGDAGPKSGIEAIINSALVSYERLPMLEVVFDRLVRMMSTSLRNFTSDNVEVTLDNVTSVRFGDYLNSMFTAVTK